MTKLDLAAIKARMKGASPWRIMHTDDDHEVYCAYPSEFWVRAYPDIEALIARVEELEAALRDIAVDVPWGTDREMWDACVRTARAALSGKP